jgi:hypothetical protein
MKYGDVIFFRIILLSPEYLFSISLFSVAISEASVAFACASKPSVLMIFRSILSMSRSAEYLISSVFFNASTLIFSIDRFKCASEKVRCNGCMSLTPDCSGYNCKIVQCLRTKNLHFCYQCPTQKEFLREIWQTSRRLSRGWSRLESELRNDRERRSRRMAPGKRGEIQVSRMWASNFRGRMENKVLPLWGRSFLKLLKNTEKDLTTLTISVLAC